jgi:murein DD-endopeptidase MepM/ murein hydrolase activator NlpD
LSLNQSVSAGDLVGYMGRMGNIAGTSFPTHVHIAVWRPLPGNVMGFVQPWWK